MMPKLSDKRAALPLFWRRSPERLPGPSSDPNWLNFSQKDMPYDFTAFGWQTAFCQPLA
jgi:hypothetical protein